jgi:carbonic anhydrase/acetyltransferase-like protein (isoleucine patch superfamily)
LPEGRAVAIYQLGDDPEYAPQLAPTAWVADSATVLGRVRMGENSSVWYGAVLRGDNDSITLGERVNVQDGSVLHTDHGYPMLLGNDVSIGHLVMLHGCTIGEGSLVGIQAIILNGARIGRNCLVGAGAVVTEGKEFPDNSLILGSPAKVVRELSAEQAARVRMAAAHYVDNAVRHRAQLKRMA